MSATILDFQKAHRERHPEIERWFTTQEIADHFGFSTKWVLRRVKEGMPHARIGARLRFKVSQAEPWLMDQK